MTMKVVTQDSTANTANTLTITGSTRGSRKKKILIHSLTVSTSGADIAADVGVLITTSTSETWNVELRSGKVFGGHFNFYKPIDGGYQGNVTIVADAGGASVVTTLSVVYELV